MRQEFAKELWEICSMFVKRVEAGEIRSIRTYSDMKDVLARIAREEC